MSNIQLVIPKGCDNAPRKQIVIDFTVALLLSNIEAIDKYIHESFIWHQLKEHKTLDGISSLLTYFQTKNIEVIDQLEVYQVITHGKFASINGVVSYASGKEYDFCHVFTFSNSAKSGKVKEIRTYRI